MLSSYSACFLSFLLAAPALAAPLRAHAQPPIARRAGGDAITAGEGLIAKYGLGDAAFLKALAAAAQKASFVPGDLDAQIAASNAKWLKGKGRTQLDKYLETVGAKGVPVADSAAPPVGAPPRSAYEQTVSPRPGTPYASDDESQGFTTSTHAADSGFWDAGPGTPPGDESDYEDEDYPAAPRVFGTVSRTPGR